MSTVTAQDLIADLREVISQAEQLLQATAEDAGEKASAMRVQTERSLHGARKRLHALERHMNARVRSAARIADRYAHRNTWSAIGLAAGLGFLVGWLTVRR
jgi:ElaB/YqjD/DUF883 family membrane-anchored ribosome-binding protein